MAPNPTAEMRFGVAGASGRMGRTLIAAIREAGDTLAAASERPGCDAVGADAGECAGVGTLGVALSAEPAFEGCDAVLDFTSPAASVALAERLADTGVAHVIGTTGFSPADDAALGDAARRAAIVKSGNMSLGVNLLASLVRQAAAALPDADVEILEMHHRRKVDAPSGTALLLGEAAATGRGISLADHALYARQGITGARESGTIGFATLRGGTVIGEHEVILALDSERIVLSHVAEDRTVFARGALAAGRWARGRAPGLYTMNDVLGLTG